ncbi:hypothetical protein MUDAN_DOGOELCO_03393 [Lactiplantibacillus mudanjiangensis]|uniref:hypothetical protein n=1 Tax=Lactiplantibacillus mudanjiangensis TaxID=1296538 RepID=UPI00101508DF|nr:hypothetical protein [Lactiplantibacillus mudanjiangensis]VDG32233.1 hypothetical protein MUDAN_DOGOELCO_03393 [Lactiplantibacillus mudanjiangensis]
MAIYINGKSIHPFINGKRIGTIYRGGSKVYQDYVPVGTLLATNTDNNVTGDDLILNLSDKISRAKNGITITYTKYYEYQQGGLPQLSDYGTGQGNIPKSQLVVGKTVVLPVSPSFGGSSGLSIKIVSEKSLQIPHLLINGPYNDGYYLFMGKVVTY